MCQVNLILLAAAWFGVCTGWTFDAEEDVQACRDLLTANLVTVYTDGERYIITNVLTGAYMTETQPSYLRGTRTQKLPKEVLMQMATNIEKTAGELPDDYNGAVSAEAPMADIMEALIQQAIVDGIIQQIYHAGLALICTSLAITA